MVDKENIKIKFDEDFKKTFKKIDNSYNIKVKKQINKIIKNPLIKKDMGVKKLFFVVFQSFHSR